MRARGWRMTECGRPLEPVEWEIGPPGEGEALLEVLACGVCHTDVGFLFDGVPTRKPPPLVLGHEIVGVVREVGPGAESTLLGRTVLVPAVMPCGRCDACARGRGDVCPSQIFPGNDVDGGFATHVVVPAAPLVPVDRERFAGRDLRSLAVVADAVSTAYAAVRKAEVREGDVAVFVGAGGVGGFGAQIARALGARVVCVDVDDARLKALAGVGLEAGVDASGLSEKDLKQRVRAAVRELGGGRAFWKVFETSGTPAGQRSAFGLLPHGGTLAVVGYTPEPVEIHLSRLMALAARAEGTWGCPPEWFPEVLDLVARGDVRLEPFVEIEELDHVQRVLEEVRSGRRSRRPVLVPSP